MSKRVLAILCALLMAISLVACSSSSDDGYHFDPETGEAWYDEGYGDDYGEDEEVYWMDELVEEAESYYTPNSSAFSWVGYNYDYEALVVDFRTSGTYIYYDVPEWVWEDFIEADSLGGYYNDCIKGYYDWDEY